MISEDRSHHGEQNGLEIIQNRQHLTRFWSVQSLNFVPNPTSLQVFKFSSLQVVKSSNLPVYSIFKSPVSDLGSAECAKRLNNKEHKSKAKKRKSNSLSSWRLSRPKTYWNLIDFLKDSNRKEDQILLKFKGSLKEIVSKSGNMAIHVRIAVIAITRWRYGRLWRRYFDEGSDWWRGDVLGILWTALQPSMILPIKPPCGR